MRRISLLLTLVFTLVGCGNHTKTTRDAPYLTAQGWVFPDGSTIASGNPAAAPAAPIGGATTAPGATPANPTPITPVGNDGSAPTPVGLPGSGPTPVSGGVPAVPAPTSTASVSFAQMIQPIFTANCTTCHGASGSSPVLTTGSAYEAIVGIPSSQSGLNHVQPGNSAMSYLFRKVAGTHLGVGGTGGRMPLNMPQLVQAEVDLLQSWIDSGAPNN